MADLLWRLASDMSQIPARSVLPDGKRVHMEGRGYLAVPPAEFDLLRVYSPLVRSVARHILRKRGWKHLDGDTWPAGLVGEGECRTEAFHLTTARFTGTHRWRFADRSDRTKVKALRSYEVRTARFAAVGFNGNIGTPPTAPLDAKVSGEVTIPVGLDDPVVRLDLIMPWETPASDGSLLREIVRNELAGDERSFDEALYVSVLGYLERYLPSGAPDGSHATIGEEPVRVDPGETQSVEVDIVVPVGTGVAFALMATNIDDAEQLAVSDVVIAERGRDGIFALLHAED